jgi:hypothetical protein
MSQLFGGGSLPGNPKTKPIDFVPRRFRIFNDTAARFDQGKWWHGVEGYILIVDMDRRHRLNAARMLERNARKHAELYWWAITRHCADAPDEVWNSAIHDEDIAMADPAKWIRGTKIYRALIDMPKADFRTDDLMAERSAAMWR